ncbi:chitin binding protein [Rutstroemia sp. NJR-2017a BBW]|nr:chitin binding protein [Rutstroemia sp. NJR-2017a BBW]
MSQAAQQKVQRTGFPPKSKAHLDVLPFGETQSQCLFTYNDEFVKSGPLEEYNLELSSPALRKMSRMLRIFLVVQFSTICWAQSLTSSFWSEPNGNFANFTEELSTGQTLTLAWNGLPSGYYVLVLANLWLTPWDYGAHPASQLITEGVNMNNSGTYNWTIALSDSVNHSSLEGQYVLRFQQASSQYDPDDEELLSPGIYIFNGGDQGATTSGVSSKTQSTSSAASSTQNPTSSRSSSVTSPTPTSFSSSPTPRSSTNPAVSSSTPIILLNPQSSTSSPVSTGIAKKCENCGLSRGAIVGIGLGVPAGVLVLAAIAYFIFSRRWKRKRALSTLPEVDNSEEKSIPPVTSNQPVAELGGREIELELDGREVGPDLHELSST